MEEIDMNGGDEAYHAIISWCLSEVATDSGDDTLSSSGLFVRRKVRALILEEQDRFGKLFDDDDQATCFAYYHFICFLSVVYLPLFAMSAGLIAGIGAAAYWLTDIVAGFIAMLKAIFVFGLRVLAENMSDPFGYHVENLGVLHHVNETWQASQTILLAQRKASPCRQEYEHVLLAWQALGQ